MEEMRTFGYLCPECGKPVRAARSVFTLEAAGLEVACGCGKSALTAAYDGKGYRFRVPCGLCGDTHEALCGADQALRQSTALACPKTKQFCCFMGPEGVVEKHLKELEILAEKEKRQEQAPEAFLDSVIMYEVLSELRDIAARPGGISCACGSSRYGMEIRRSAVDLICRDCGAKLRVPAVSDEDLDSLCCHMRLVIPGRGEKT
ncbi:MAG: hypothetical protein HFF90_12835 [Oscillibacter sp.]|nr:hypothetical protein [Oscillibacter sp.]